MGKKLSSKLLFISSPKINIDGFSYLGYIYIGPSFVNLGLRPEGDAIHQAYLRLLVLLAICKRRLL